MRRIAYRQILIPDTVFDIERDETELLIAELRLTARTGAPMTLLEPLIASSSQTTASPTTSPTRLSRANELASSSSLGAPGKGPRSAASSARIARAPPSSVGRTGHWANQLSGELVAPPLAI
jgi:hypothetical protein